MPITTYFFDLDGTLYPHDNGMWEAIAERMENYMQEKLGFPEQDIPQIRQDYFETYGTTLRGLQVNYEIDTQEYLAYVHDIPLADYLSHDKRLNDILNALPQKKWIFTNSDLNHAKRVMTALGIDHHFEGILDITYMDFLNKPQLEVYQRAMQASGTMIPEECLMIDDVPHNLDPAKDLGWTTVLVSRNSQTPDRSPKIDYAIKSIHDFPEVIRDLTA